MLGDSVKRTFFWVLGGGDLPPSPELGLGLRPTLSEPRRQVQPTAPRNGFGGSTENASTDDTASSGANGENPTGHLNPSLSPRMHLRDRTMTRGPPHLLNNRRRPVARALLNHPPRPPLSRTSSSRTITRKADEEFFEAPAAPPLRQRRTRPVAAATRSDGPAPRPTSRLHQRTSDRHDYSAHGLFAHTDGLVTNAI